MHDSEWLLRRFQEQHDRLRAVAYRMLGSLSDTDDALQEAWVRLSRADVDAVENLEAWLTTVVGRVCLNMLRSRERRREQPYGARIPDPIVRDRASLDPADEVLMADSVGLALMVVIETLSPAERLAFVLHDMFEIPFEEIAAMLDRSPDAARQLASRARRRIRGQAKIPDVDLDTQHEVVSAFFAAGREGDFERLVALLDPAVVLVHDGAPTGDHRLRALRGADKVARASMIGARSGRDLYPAVVNGGPGAVILDGGRPVTVLGFTVLGGVVAEIDAISDPERIARLEITQAVRRD